LVFIEVIGVGAGKLEGEAENLMRIGWDIEDWLSI
jgi:hypothetical protein